jgi:hypothetical protein
LIQAVPVFTGTLIASAHSSLEIKVAKVLGPPHILESVGLQIALTYTSNEVADGNPEKL